jgi:hypothetical protein
MERDDRIRRRRAAQEYGRELMAQHQQHQARRLREERDLDESFERRMAERDLEERELAEEVAQLGPRLRVSGIP